MAKSTQTSKSKSKIDTDVETTTNVDNEISVDSTKSPEALTEVLDKKLETATMKAIEAVDDAIHTIQTKEPQVKQMVNTPASNEPNNVPSTTAPPVENYEEYQLIPSKSWPPPVYIKKNVTPSERYYIEHRWYSQWSFFDKKATENKNKYFRTQLIVGLGSVTVPVLVGIRTLNDDVNNLLYIFTIIISLSVAMATAIESLYTFGDNWRSYRQAAEDLHQEKTIYDVKAGRYQDNPAPFTRFVERCEEIIAQQNGRWIQTQEKQAQQAAEDMEEFEARYVDQDDNEVVEIRRTTHTPREQASSENGQAVPTFSLNDPEPEVSAEDSSLPTSAG